MKTLSLLLLTGWLAVAADPEPGFVSLFNGKDFTGWKVNENTDTFTIKNGAIVAHGNRSHCFYMGSVNGGDFKDFEFKVDVMTEPGANGGIYFHTAYQAQGWPDKGFEVQVNNSFDRDPRKTASLYMVKDNGTKVAEDGKWFTEHIVVKGKAVTVYVDGKKITEWTQPADWKGTEGFAQRVLSSGTFALQGHDPGSTVHYRNIRVKVLK